MTIINDFYNRLPGTWQNKFNGRWIGDLGWNFISQPRVAGESDKKGKCDFEMHFDQMRETITFKKILGPPARNVGIKRDAGRWADMAYEVSIETPTGVGLHHEVCHFLMNVAADGITKEKVSAPHHPPSHHSTRQRHDDNGDN